MFYVPLTSSEQQCFKVSFQDWHERWREISQEGGDLHHLLYIHVHVRVLSVTKCVSVCVSLQGSRPSSGTPTSSRGLSSPRKFMKVTSLWSGKCSGGDSDGGSGEGAAVCSEATRLVEQQALANIG